MAKPRVDLELILDERAHLLLVIDEVRVAGILREAGGQVGGVVLQGRLQHGDAVGGERGRQRYKCRARWCCRRRRGGSMCGTLAPNLTRLRPWVHVTMS